MIKSMSKIYIFILTLLLVMIVTGCGEIFMYGGNHKPDDEISKAICEAVGRKKVYYSGTEIYDSEDKVVYNYLVHDYKDENVLEDMVKAANAVMKENEMTGKINLDLREEVPGGNEAVASLRTYYEDEDGCEEYGSFQNLHIYGTELSKMRNRSPYDKLSTYINLPDIKSLAVSKKIAQIAEEEGIDWYEIWPDLEHYRVFEW